MSRMSGKVAVVTGGASGIGRATARRLVAEGASVAVIDRNPESIEGFAAELPGTMTFQADTTDEEACRSAVVRIVDRFGPIDTLITSAGMSITKTLEDTSLDEWNLVFNNNVVGTYVWIRQISAQMPAGSAIVTVSSQLAMAGGTTNAAYISSKGAILSLTRTLALELASRSIRVNTVLPGAIETPAFRSNLARRADPEAARQTFVARHPMGRIGEADEVANAITFLASDEASFVTGALLPVDGGWLVG